MRREWPATTKEAIALQRELAGQVVREDDFGKIEHVAGVDVGFEERGRITRAAVAVLNFPALTLACHAVVRRPTTFPYVPGLLSFREAPALLDAFEKLEQLPDLILCDGQGIAHPRRFGIACHLGLLLDRPTIGVAKSRLTGTFEEPPRCRGGWTPLTDGEETLGAVLRTRTGVKPLFISTGHRVGLASAIDWTLACTTRYRLPETTRWAHRLASGTPAQIERALERERAGRPR